MNLHLTGVRACVFVAYGTVFDVNSAAQQAQKRASREMAATRGGLADETATVYLAVLSLP